MVDSLPGLGAACAEFGVALGEASAAGLVSVLGVCAGIGLLAAVAVKVANGSDGNLFAVVEAVGVGDVRGVDVEEGIAVTGAAAPVSLTLFA